MSLKMFAKGLSDVSRYFDELPDIAEKSAVLAVNQVASGIALTTLRGEMRKQVNFPKGYLESDRLGLRKKASLNNPEAIIRGRDRPTLLSRFAEGQNESNTRGRGVRVSVKKGRTSILKKAFMLRLKNGNLGLAVRVKDGESLTNTTGAKLLSDNVYLLYGPSVDQVFGDVVDIATPVIGLEITRQFLRQFARLSHGRAG